MMCQIALALSLAAAPAAGQTLVAAHTIRAQAIIAAGDLGTGDAEVPGGIALPEDAIGLETRVAIYQGRPILRRDVGAPSVIDRNQPITIAFTSGGLTIQAAGRALERGGAGDMIRAMNMSSHTTVRGVIEPDGTLRVGPKN